MVAPEVPGEMVPARSRLPSIAPLPASVAPVATKTWSAASDPLNSSVPPPTVTVPARDDSASISTAANIMSFVSMVFSQTDQRACKAPGTPATMLPFTVCYAKHLEILPAIWNYALNLLYAAKSHAVTVLQTSYA